MSECFLRRQSERPDSTKLDLTTVEALRDVVSTTLEGGGLTRQLSRLKSQLQTTRAQEREAFHNAGLDRFESTMQDLKAQITSTERQLLDLQAKSRYAGITMHWSLPEGVLNTDGLWDPHPPQDVASIRRCI